MKKIFKGILSFAVAFIVLFNFTACKTPLSATTTDSSKTVYSGKDTNGGVTLVHDGYLYFINGTKTNDGTSATKNTRSAICRVKLGEEDKIDEESYEVVVDNLVGYKNGSIFIFGDFLYYATPNNDVNYKNSKLYDQTKFMRYDLVNKKSYEIYTTKQNSSSETISYAYYVIGEELDLVVFESTNTTITSLKVDAKVTENYVISGVSSCVLSENFGKCETENATVDANSYVYYTKAPETGDYPQTGNYVYKTLPNQDNSTLISSNKKTVSLLSIRNGKLLYSATSISADEDVVYYDTISNDETKLSFNNVLSYTTYENVVFMENEDGSISVVAFDSDSSEIVVYTKSSDKSQEIEGVVVNTISVKTASSSSSSSSSISFVGTVTLDEKLETEETESNAEESENEEVQYDKVTYLIYIESNIAYKIEIMRNGEVSKFNDPVKLSTSTISAADGYLVPKIIDGYLYAFAKEVKEEKEADNVYLFRFDLTIDDDSKDFGTMIGIIED